MFKRKAKEKKIKTPRFQTFRDAYAVTKQVKPWIGIALVAIFLTTLLIGIGIGIAVGRPVYVGFIFTPLAFLTTLLVFTRVAGRAAYTSIDGQMGAGVPIIPTIIWGSQRIWTKGVKRNLKHNKFPVTVVFGEPIFYERGADVEQAELHLRTTLLAMLRQVQEDYPDSHVGQRWAPVRLGGTAPAPLN